MFSCIALLDDALQIGHVIIPGVFRGMQWVQDDPKTLRGIDE